MKRFLATAGLIVFRTLLVLYPKSVRIRFEHELIETFTARQGEAADRGPLALLGFWCRELRASTSDAIVIFLDKARRRPRQRVRFPDISSDFLLTLRRIASSPVYALAVVSTLALGTGANTAVLSLIHAITWQALPFPDSERLLIVSASHPGNDSGGNSISYREMMDVAERSQTLERVEPFLDWLNVTVVDAESSRSLLASFVTHHYFDLIGASASIGRQFSEEENRFGAATPVVVLSDRVFRTEYGGEPSTIGRRIRVNDVDATIIGVLSADDYDLNSYWGDGTDLWMPMFTIDTVMGGSYLESRTSRSMNGVAVMKPDVTPRMALDDVLRISAELEREFPGTQTGYGIHVKPLRESFFGELQRPSLLAWAAAALVLLMAAANVVGLLLVRGLQRRREIAARAALGATRGRVLSILAMEPLLLGLVGLASGTFVSTMLTNWFARSEVVHLPEFFALEPNPVVFGLSAAISSSIIAVSALAPSWVTHRVDLREALSNGGKGTHAGHAGVRSGLIVFEIALATSLLIVALLTIHSFRNLQRTELGYRSENLVTFRFDMRSERYMDPDARVRFAEALQQELETDRAIESAILWGPNMLGRGYINASLETVDQPALTPADYHRAGRHHVGVGGLEALGVRRIAGRAFTPYDTRDTPSVVILSETLANRLWPDESALGKRVRFFDIEFEVVGVAADVLHRPRFVGDDEIYAVSDLQDVYLPYRQYPQQRSVLIVRTTGESMNLAERVRVVVSKIDPDVPVYDIDTMDSRLEKDDALNAFVGELMGGFALIALVLSLIGIYGLLQFLVQQRWNELGIRLSIGARPADVARIVLRQAAAIATAGVAFGLLGGALLAQIIVGLLYEIEPLEWTVFASASAVLFVTAVAAAAPSALRAARIDPVTALRSE